jgi:hypothetical protein
MRRSTTTMMEFLPSDLGIPIIKSIETSSQHRFGIYNGCRILGVLIVSPLFYWKTTHLATNF